MVKVRLPKVRPEAYTKKFQIEIYDKSRKVHYCDERQFDRFEDFRAFIKPLYDRYGVKCSESGLSGTFGPVEFTTNYSVLEPRAPKNGYRLPDILVGRQNIKWRKREPATVEAITPKTPPRASGNVIVLKALCKELQIDDRQARIALRRAIKQGKLTHERQSRWEWPSDSDELKVVREILKGIKK